MIGFGGFLSGLGSGLSAALNYQLARQQAADARQMLSQQTALSGQSAELARRQADLAWDQWDTYKQTLAPLEQEAARQAVRDLGLLAPLREAQVGEALRDVELYRPLKEAAVTSTVRSMERYEPLEDMVVQDALSGERADPLRAAGRAAADVRASFAKARQGEERKLASMGLDPARMAWMGHSSAMEEAAAEAAARTRAAETETDRAETATFERRLAALGLRRQVPLSQPSSLNAAPSGPLGDPAGQALNLLRTGQTGLAGAASDQLAMAREAQQQAGRYYQQTIQHLGGLFSALGG